MCRPEVLFLTVVVVVIVVAASVVGAVKPVVIPPTRNATTEAALIIVPAGKISGLAYKPLATTIQHVSSAKLWIVLLTDWLAGFPNPAELPIGVSDATSALEKQGMLSDNVFLAGHSLGGENVAPYGTKHGKKRLKGVLLYGAYMTRLDVPLTDYPVPVMHLSGDLDGRVRITRIADTFQELQQSVSKNQSAMYRTPVVIMRGVNHAQFASGPVPAKMTFYDLKAEVSSATAYQLIANQTAAFITTSLAVPGEDLTNAKNILNSSYSETNAIFEPLLRLKAFDVNTHNSDVWGVSAQVQMSRLSNYSIRVTNQILTSEKDFVTSKPSIDTTSPGTPLVRTLSHVRYVPNPGDLPTFTHSPMYVAVKMKSFAAIHNATHLQPGISTNITCKDINEVAFQVAVNAASDVANQRYQSRGRKVKFQDDWNAKTQLQWSASQINLFEDDVTLNVTSPFLWTSLNETEFPGFTGMHYCKLLAPYRAAEWIYVDSLRTHPIE